MELTLVESGEDPAFQRTRENGAEFGRAGSLEAEDFANFFKSFVLNSADSRMVSRLTQRMVKSYPS